MKKIVVKVAVGNECQRREVLAEVAKLNGIKSMAIDADKGLLTIIGTVDPICIIKKLRKCKRYAVIDSVGDPPKPEEKKPEEKPPEEKKPTCPPVCYPCPPPCPPPMYGSYGYVEYNPNPCAIL